MHSHNLHSHNLSSHNLSEHSLFTHTTCSHTTCPHTTCSHTTCHHTSCHHTSCHQTTCSHTLSSHTPCPHTTCPHTTCPHRHNFVWQVWHLVTWTFTLHRCVAGLALGDMYLHFAWHLVTSTLTFRGKGGTYGTGPALVVSSHNLSSHNIDGVALTALGRLWWRTRFPNDAVDAAAVCVGGVALGEIDCHFAWQAWHLVTATVTLRGITHAHTTCPRTTCPQTTCSQRHRPSLCVAGVALGDIDYHFAWQACHLRQLLCVAGVALRALGWLWWRTGFPNDAVDAAALCVAGVALGDIDCHFAWQAWHLVTSTFSVAGLALGDIDYHFAWKACHLRHWAGSAHTTCPPTTCPRTTCPQTTCSQRHRPSLCVAGVALGDIDTLRGRRATYGSYFAWPKQALVAHRVPK